MRGSRRAHPRLRPRGLNPPGGAHPALRPSPQPRLADVQLAQDLAEQIVVDLIAITQAVQFQTLLQRIHLAQARARLPGIVALQLLAVLGHDLGLDLGRQGHALGAQAGVVALRLQGADRRLDGLCPVPPQLLFARLLVVRRQAAKQLWQAKRSDRQG
ncbi:hypothetical protein GCM10027514_30390 [Azotobacter armeniacus]